MPPGDQLKHQHLLWRAGFGPHAADQTPKRSFHPQRAFEELSRLSASQPQPIDVADNYLKGLVMGMEQANTARQQLTEEQRKMIRQQNREGIKNLNLTWLNEMVHSQAQLREKMALFWHGHFACRNVNIFYQQLLLDVIRRNALGNFRTLLHEVSKSAAMLNFLNNNQNRKDHPNENFAREVMELFTIGRGNYTETDVKEAARAFTGWGANVRGEFVFRRMIHDFGGKTFFGKTGAFDGHEILDILLEQRKTAAYLTRKIYAWFVNESVNEQHVEWLANRFYANDYNILSLMHDIFTSDWFYDERNIGSRIKSPVELLVGIRRTLPMEIENAEVQLLLQRILGQVLFLPPNVAGWPGGKNWIDSSSLMFRLRLPQLIRDAAPIVVRPKDDDDQMMGMRDGTPANNKTGPRVSTPGGQIRAQVQWQTITKKFDGVARDRLETAIADGLLQSRSRVSNTLLKKNADATSRESYIKSVVLKVMSTAEYQLC